MADSWSKATGVRLTVGAIIGLIAFAVFIDRRFGTLERYVPFVERTRERQDTWIERRTREHRDHKAWSDAQHAEQQDELDALHLRLHELCESLAAEHGRELCE